MTLWFNTEQELYEAVSKVIRTDIVKLGMMGEGNYYLEIRDRKPSYMCIGKDEIGQLIFKEM